MGTIARTLERVRALPRQLRDPVGAGLGRDPAPSLVSRVGAWAGGWGGRGGLPRNREGEVTWPPAGPSATPVGEATVLGIPAAGRALHLIQNAVASCAPLQQYDAEGLRLTLAETNQVLVRPWPLLSTHEYWEQAIAAAVLFGNFIGVHQDLDDLGYPRQVVPLHPAEVQMITVKGMPLYGWHDQVFEWDEIVHVRGYTPPGGLWGFGVIELYRTALGGIIDQAEYGSSVWRDSAMPDIVIKLARPEISKEQAQVIYDRWLERHSGPVRRPAVIPSTMDIQPLSFSPHDAEFLDSRKFSVAEIAYMFDLDPADLGAVVGASSVVYQNLEQRAVDRQTNSYAKWIHRFEQAWTDLLPGRQAARFDTDNVLRTDTLARLQADEIGLRTGVYTLNDARRRERLPLYGPWADQPFAQPPTVEPDKEPVAALPPGEVT